MVHPLDGVEAKLARADAHFADIERAIQGFVDYEPDRIPGEFDSNLPGYVFYEQRDSAALDWLGPIIGDCVHNLRAALDYLVWGLTPVSIQQSKLATKVEFPIYTDEVGWNRWALAKMPGTDPLAQAAIKCLQPFNGPDCRPNFAMGTHPKDRPLWHLFDLDNWDKHRSLNLALHVYAGRFDGFDDFGVLMPKNVFIPGSFERGAVLARVQIPLARPNVGVHFVATSDIRFDGHGPESVRSVPVLKTLADIRAEIRGRVVPKLAPFFESR